MLFMGLRGRHNFLNMARYGDYSEQTYCNNFYAKYLCNVESCLVLLQEGFCWLLCT